MSQVEKKSGIRRTSTKDAIKRVEKPQIAQQVQQTSSTESNINVMEILATKHPMNGEDYAIQLFYKTYRNAFMKVTSKTIDEDQETAHLVINGNKYTVNIRTAKIVKN